MNVYRNAGVNHFIEKPLTAPKARELVDRLKERKNNRKE